MFRKTFLPKAAIFAAFGAFGMVASVALAHVTVNPGEAPADSYARLDFRIGHGCEGSPTTSIRVQVPSGVTSVRAENKPGWNADTVTGPLDEPYESHGELVTEGVIEVSWSGGTLPDNLFEDFGMSVRLPDRPGETLYFPVIQECEEGSHAWIQIAEPGQDPHDLDEPAPALRLTAASGDGHGHGHEDSSGAAHDDDSGEASGAPVVAAQAATSDTSTAAWLALSVAVLAAVLAGTGMVLAVRRR